MNKLFKVSQEKKKKQLKKMNKTFQDLKTEIEIMKKTQTDGILEMNNLGIHTGTVEPKFTNWIQEM